MERWSDGDVVAAVVAGVLVVGDVGDVAEAVVVVELPLALESHRWSWCPAQTPDVFAGIPNLLGWQLIVGQDLKRKIFVKTVCCAVEAAMISNTNRMITLAVYFYFVIVSDFFFVD